MTQIWPGLGVAPVPTVESIICKPEAVVMVFPAVWAGAPDGARRRTPAMTMAMAIGKFRNWKRRILLASFVTEGEVTCEDGRGLSTNSDLRQKSGLAPPQMLRRRLGAQGGCQSW